MAYSYLEADNLKDALHDSEEYMEPFWEPLAEIERVTRGKPGRIPEGKPKVTDGTLAGMRRELPKQIIQQLPTGKVFIKDNPDMEAMAQAVLTDIILPNANSGGTPYAKSKNAIKDTFSNGASFAHCFFNRRGNVFSADYRRVYAKDVLFEKGKVSEFDSNFMWLIGWYTEMDIKAIIWQEEQLKKKSDERKDKYKGQWDTKLLQKLLDKGATEKEDKHKTEDEKKYNQSNGFFKIAHAMQIGAGATFYSYAPSISECVKKCVNIDPRGVIPLHGLIPEEDYANPFGEPIAAISVGKQNLLDFDMQMYQYNQGMQQSPPVKKWGQTPSHKIKLVPDAIISMSGNKQTDDFEVVNISNEATRNYANNASYIKTQMYNEQGGSNDSSISAEAGSVGFSKTSRGVSEQASRLSVGKNDIRKSYELWQGRIYETLLNIHFAESKGMKELELEPSTMKRMQLDKPPKIDYDKDYGTIKITVDASSSEAADNDKETEKLVTIMEITSKAGGLPMDKQMLIQNQIIKNSGVDDPEALLYTDEEIEQAKQEIAMQKQMAMQQMMNPPQPEPPMPDPALPPEQMQPPMQESDPIQEDKAMAFEQLLARGIPEDKALILLQGIESGEL